jgi:hypothetical protein
MSEAVRRAGRKCNFFCGLTAAVAVEPQKWPWRRNDSSRQPSAPITVEDLLLPRSWRILDHSPRCLQKDHPHCTLDQCALVCCCPGFLCKQDSKFFEQAWARSVSISGGGHKVNPSGTLRGEMARCRFFRPLCTKRGSKGYKDVTAATN